MLDGVDPLEEADKAEYGDPLDGTASEVEPLDGAAPEEEPRVGVG